MRQQRDQLVTLLEITNALVATRDLEALLRQVSACLHRVLRHDAASLALHDPAAGTYKLMALDQRLSGETVLRLVDQPTPGTVFQQLLQTRAPFAREQLDAAEFPQDPAIARVVAKGIVSVCSVPILAPEGVLGVLSMGRRAREAFSADEIALLGQTGTQLVLAIG